MEPQQAIFEEDLVADTDYPGLFGPILDQVGGGDTADLGNWASLDVNDTELPNVTPMLYINDMENLGLGLEENYWDNDTLIPGIMSDGIERPSQMFQQSSPGTSPESDALCLSPSSLRSWVSPRDLLSDLEFMPVAVEPVDGPFQHELPLATDGYRSESVVGLLPASPPPPPPSSSSAGTPTVGGSSSPRYVTEGMPHGNTNRRADLKPCPENEGRKSASPIARSVTKLARSAIWRGTLSATTSLRL